MLTDEQIIEFIEKKQLKKYEHGDRTPHVLNAVLDSLEKKYYISLMERICRCKNNIHDFIDLDNGLNRLITIAINNRSYTIYILIGFVNTYDMEEVENQIIKTNDAKYILNFAEHGVNHIEKLENAIIRINDAKYIYEFAKNIDGANIEKIEKALIDINNKGYINLLKNNKTLMYLKRRQILIKRQIEENIIPFAMTILLENQDKRKILDELIENVNDTDSLLKLKVYMTFLNNSSKNLEKAFELDKKYTEALQPTKKKNNEK